MSERFATTTTVRRPRTALLWSVAVVATAIFVVQTVFHVHVAGLQNLGWMPFWFLGPILAAIQRRPKVDRAAIDASAEGLRIGDELVPRAKLTSAVLRREQSRSFVLLRGSGFAAANVDVEVSTDDDADRLCRALALDAASTTAEFTLFRRRSDTRAVATLAAVVGMAAALGVAMARGHLPHFLFPVLMVVIFAALLPLLFFTRRAKLRVGADGIVLQQGLGRRRFIGHDQIERVRASGSSVVIADKQGEILADLTVAGTKERRKRKRTIDLEGQAQSVVWRIEKAREAYRALAGDAPQAALALDRGDKTAREWLDQLRAIGAGAGATFRSAQLTRDQLLRIVESTTAATKERIAAVAALHDALTEEEKPRIRVAADRCAEPALGQAMVRVALAPTEEELETALDEASQLETST